MKKQIVIGNEVKGNEGKFFIKESNFFYALYKNQVYVGNCLSSKEAKGWIK